jgi:hypothetical protein
MGLVVQLVGAGLVLVAFALLQLHRTTTTARGYLLLNAAGSALLAGSAAAGRQWGFVALNATWLVVSLSSLVRARPDGPLPTT